MKPNLCGSGLARDGITAVHQANRIACIASKPAPTHSLLACVYIDTKKKLTTSPMPMNHTMERRIAQSAR